jgi:hypothetical protein
MPKPPMPWLRGRGSALALAVVLLVTACSAEATPLPTIPPVPAGWATTDNGDLSLALPPWLIPFDTTAAIFANEIVDPGADWVELMAEGPRTAESQPGAGDSLEAWLRQRIDFGPGLGQPTIRLVDLPAGSAVSIERLDRPGTRLAWRIAAYAIRTPRGVAYLLLDGPPDRWAERADDLALIPWFIRFGPSPLR